MKKIFLLSILISHYVSAQQTLHLQDAVNMALKNNFDIQLAKNNADINTIYNNYGVAGGLPLVIATGNDAEQVTNLKQKLSNGTNTTKSGVTGNTLTAGISAGILLYNGMRVIATKNRLEQLELQGRELLNVQIENTIAAVTTQYYDVVRQQQYLQTIEASIDIARKRLEILETRQQVGLANNADIYQAQLDLNALLQSKLSQQLIIQQAKTDLLTLINAKEVSAVAINDTIIVDKNLHLDSVINNLDNNPLLIAAGQQIKINELVEKETAALRYPSLRLNSAINYNRSQSTAGFTLLNQTYGPSLSLSLSVPIYNGSLYVRQQKAAAINTENAVLQKQSIARENTGGAVKTFEAYSNALKQLDTEIENYKLSQQLLVLVFQKFQLRESTILDLKAAQQSFEESGYRLVNISFAAKTAETELKRLMYRLDF